MKLATEEVVTLLACFCFVKIEQERNSVRNFWALLPAMCRCKNQLEHFVRLADVSGYAKTVCLVFFCVYLKNFKESCLIERLCQLHGRNALSELQTDTEQ